MNKSTIHKQTIFAILIFLASLNLSAQEKSQKEYKFNVIPQIDFGMFQLENDTLLYSPSGTLMFKYQKEEEAEINGPDVIACSFSYGQDIFSKYDSEINEKQFHKLGLFGKVVSAKNTFLLKIDDRGAKPFESYKNFEGLFFYSRKIIDSNSTQLDIGGGLAATDTGIVLGGLDIFIVPLPMIHFSYKNQFIDTEMEWIGIPDAFITLFPLNMFRIRSYLALAGFDLPKDIQGDIGLCCYPFKDGFLKDLASVSLGATHEVKKFRINTEKSIKYDYFTAYGQLSITALKIRGGYAFGGRQTFRGPECKYAKEYDGGFFLNVQAMYKF